MFVIALVYIALKQLPRYVADFQLLSTLVAAVRIRTGIMPVAASAMRARNRARHEPDGFVERIVWREFNSQSTLACRVF